MTETFAEERNRMYLKFRRANPGTSFAEWSNLCAVDYITRGLPHATLGANLLKYENWWDAGAKSFARYRDMFSIGQGSKVVDYGCGSLRVGGHFIRFLDPGCYFGMDVTMDLIETGKQLIGNALLAGKAPQFAPITDSAIRSAIAFGADIVFSSAVCYHVHPGEAAVYFANLAKLAHRPGAVLFLDISVSNNPVGELQLSMPLDYFKNALPGLDFVRLFEIEYREEQGQTIGVAEFRRPSA